MHMKVKTKGGVTTVEATVVKGVVPIKGVILNSKVVSKPGAALEVKVFELTPEALRAISDGLTLGPAAVYQKAHG